MQDNHLELAVGNAEAAQQPIFGDGEIFTVACSLKRHFAWGGPIIATAPDRTVLAVAHGAVDLAIDEVEKVPFGKAGSLVGNGAQFLRKTAIAARQSAAGAIGLKYSTVVPVARCLPFARGRQTRGGDCHGIEDPKTAWGFAGKA